jgi:hypothetical protein
MKLREITLVEGLVDITTLMTIGEVVRSGITNNAQTLIIAKSILAIQKAQVAETNNFNSYFNEFSPSKDLLDSVKALSVQDNKKLAIFLLDILSNKSVQLMSLPSLNSVTDFLYCAAQAEAND